MALRLALGSLLGPPQHCKQPRVDGTGPLQSPPPQELLDEALPRGISILQPAILILSVLFSILVLGTVKDEGTELFRRSLHSRGLLFLGRLLALTRQESAGKTLGSRIGTGHRIQV